MTQPTVSAHPLDEAALGAALLRMGPIGGRRSRPKPPTPAERADKTPECPASSGLIIDLRRLDWPPGGRVWLPVKQPPPGAVTAGQVPAGGSLGGTAFQSAAIRASCRRDRSHQCR